MSMSTFDDGKNFTDPVLSYCTTFMFTLPISAVKINFELFLFFIQIALSNMDILPVELICKIFELSHECDRRRLKTTSRKMNDSYKAFVAIKKCKHNKTNHAKCSYLVPCNVYIKNEKTVIYHDCIHDDRVFCRRFHWWCNTNVDDEEMVNACKSIT